MIRNDELFISKIYSILDKEQVRYDEPLKTHTSFKIGGPCDYFLEPRTIREINETLKLCKTCGLEVFVLGNGSNLLVTDKGFRGVIIHIYNNFSDVSITGAQVKAQSGISLASLSAKAANNHLTGIEFASGIPGTLGGAVCMNAGAYGGEMKQVVSKVIATSLNGELREFTKDELDFGYRHSVLQDGDYIVLEVEIELSYGVVENIRDTMKELNARRKEKQPLECLSAGSTFKRPEGYYAGKLIMDAGLRGYNIGDAMVSEKHCGFVINTGEATFDEVYRLIQYIKHQVKERFQVELEREVKIIGEL